MNKKDFLERVSSLTDQERYKKLGLVFNPFPRSGTTNINGTDELNQKLVPVSDLVAEEIDNFIVNAISSNNISGKDKFICATIMGDYGSGKTQMLMYTKSQLNRINNSPHSARKPYVIYIDNPGESLLMLIGNIIMEIGEENLKKYLWDDVIEGLMEDPESVNSIKKITNDGILIFEGVNNDPFSATNRVNYKQFLNICLHRINDKYKRAEFNDIISSIIKKVLGKATEDEVVAYYFYDFLNGDYGMNKTWEAMTNGSLRRLAKKEAKIIRYIVRLMKEQGFTDFFILVDEFEDLTEGRLSKLQLDNYLYNLRTLLDREREWCLMISMNPHAFEKLKQVSPPLADRLTDYEIQLNNINQTEGEYIVSNYISLAGGSGIIPFTQDGIGSIVNITEGNIRRFLRSCFQLVEIASTNGNTTIDNAFVEQNLKNA